MQEYEKELRKLVLATGSAGINNKLKNTQNFSYMPNKTGKDT